MPFLIQMHKCSRCNAYAAWLNVHEECDECEEVAGAD